jgi:WD40 repeat protein
MVRHAGRRMLTALADNAPAFRSPSVVGRNGFWWRLFAAVADLSPAFNPVPQRAVTTRTSPTRRSRRELKRMAASDRRSRLVAVTAAASFLVAMVAGFVWHEVASGRPSGAGRPNIYTTSWTTVTTLLNVTASVAFSPDGRLLASGLNDGQVFLADLGSGRIVGEAGGGNVPVEAVRFSPDGRTLTRISADGSVQVYDVSDPVLPEAMSAFFTPWPFNSARTHHPAALGAGGAVFASASASGQVFLGKTADMGHGKFFQASSAGIQALLFSPDGKMLATADAGGTVRLWDVGDTRQPRSLGAPLATSGGAAKALAFGTGPNADLLAVGSVDGSVRLVDVRSGRLIARFATAGSAVNALAFGPDGTALAVGDEAAKVTLWDVSDPHEPRQRGRMLTAQGGVSSLAFNVDGTALTTGTVENHLQLFKAIA